MIHEFFDSSTEQSIIKAMLVRKYFEAWAKVMIATQKRYPNHSQRIAYMDLFAGPGKYEDGTESTPLLILRKAIDEADISKRLVTFFADMNGANVDSLLHCVEELPGIDTLQYKPQIAHMTVEQDIVQQFESMNFIPTLFFVDPWGYKGLSLQLINAVVKNFGCDCIFFFNYNRVNAGIHNDKVEQHMNALFGAVRADNLRQRLEYLSPQEREVAIIEELSQALKEGTPERYVLPFTFKNERGTRTSHHLIFVSKHIRGYQIMKDIMAKESSNSNQGVATFEYSPADMRSPLLFELARPIDDLADMLVAQFAGQTLTMKEIYERHNVGTPFVSKNYKSVLLKLEQEGRIQTNPANRKRGFADHVKVTFPG
ncbi:MAG: three-Cys-motif partner protein TcmP [Chloroflexota bacterium]